MRNNRLAAFVENLENRQHLSATALGDLATGAHRRLAVDPTHNTYSFVLNKPALLSAVTSDGSSVALYNDGKEVASGSKLSTVVPVGRYSLTSYTGSMSGVQVSLGIASTNVPTRLESDVWGSGGVHLNWDDNSDNEAAYRVDRWSHIGWRRSIRVGANATAAVIDNLQPGSSVTYRVSAVTADGISTRSANVVSATTEAEDTSGLYKISIGAGQRREASWTISNDTLEVTPDNREDQNSTRQSKWVYASSWQAAVWNVVDSYDDAADDELPVAIQQPGTDGNGPTDVDHPFDGGEFKVGTGQEIRADPNVEDSNLPDDDTKFIALEDSYGSIDHDYDDFTWAVTAEKLTGVTQQFQDLNISASTAGTGWDEANNGGTRTYSENYARTQVTLTFPNTFTSWDIAQAVIPAITTTSTGGVQYDHHDPTFTLLSDQDQLNSSHTTTFRIDAFVEGRYKINQQNQWNNHPARVRYTYTPQYGSAKLGDESEAFKVDTVFNYLASENVPDAKNKSIRFIMNKYNISDSWSRAGDSVSYLASEGDDGHTAGAFEYLGSYTGRGARTTTLGITSYTSENKLASTIIHEGVHAMQEDSYYRAITSEKTAETDPYHTEYSSLFKTDLTGQDLSILNEWVAWVNDVGPRPTQGGH